MPDAFKEKINLRVTSWPTPQDYSEAVQNPATNFKDAELIASLPMTDALGLPKVASGMFASVYCMESAEGRWAMRCFLANNPVTRERYACIGDALEAAALDSIVEFDLQEEGIRVHNAWYPILKMQWCNGLSLNAWLSKNLNDRNVLERFFRKLE